MQYAVTAARWGVNGGVTAFYRLVTLVTDQEGLSTTSIVQAIKQAMKILGLKALVPALQLLVQKSMGTHPGNCIELIKGAAQRPLLQEKLFRAAAAVTLNPDHLTALVTAIPGLPELQEKMVGQMASHVEASRSPQLAVDTAAAMKRLGDMPLLQQQLAQAAVRAILAAGPVQHFSSSRKLMDAMKEHPVLLQQLVEGQVAAVIAAGPVQHLDICCELMGACKGLPALQGQLGEATVSALIAAGPVQHLSICCRLLEAFQGLPTLQRHLGESAVAAVIAAGPVQHFNSCCMFMEVFEGLPMLQRQLGEATAAALIAAGPVQHLSSCCKWMDLCASQVVVLQQMAGGVAAAVRSNRTAGLQAEKALQLLPLLTRQLPLYQAMQEAIAEGCLTSDACLTSQTDNSMLLLSGMLLQAPQLTERYYNRFAAAAVLRPNNYLLLKQLLNSAPVKVSLGSPGVQQLVAAQVANLQRMSQVPAFSWHMPQARMPGYPQVRPNIRHQGHAELRSHLICKGRLTTSYCLDLAVAVGLLHIHPYTP
jgi:hypothetical protein